MRIHESRQTSSAILLFILAMVQHPHALEKAQNEIDRVVGSNRLPDFNDRESLPMVECVIKEAQRLYHTLPLGKLTTSLQRWHGS